MTKPTAPQMIPAPMIPHVIPAAMHARTTAAQIQMVTFAHTGQPDGQYSHRTIFQPSRI
jgi:hypothetical protein